MGNLTSQYIIFLTFYSFCVFESTSSLPDRNWRTWNQKQTNSAWCSESLLLTFMTKILHLHNSKKVRIFKWGIQDQLRTVGITSIYLLALILFLTLLLIWPVLLGPKWLHQADVLPHCFPMTHIFANDKETLLGFIFERTECSNDPLHDVLDNGHCLIHGWHQKCINHGCQK